jgi:predicted neutral ceramidase superfamily lipid hydrolase
MSADPKLIVTWVLALAVPVACAVILTGFLTLLPFETMHEIVKNHFAAIVGLPVVAVFSVFLVVVLQQTSGPVKFEGLGFKFEGTSGQVVLWILCFLAMAAALKLLWTT